MDINKLKEYKKEITVILIYMLVFSSLFLVNNLLDVKNEEKLQQQSNLMHKYNSITSITASEEELEKELRAIDIKSGELDELLPKDLGYRKINEMLAQISNATGNIFSLANTKVNEVKKDDKNKSNYTEYEVRITSLEGNYAQFKSMLNVIKNYSSKVAITKFTITKNSEQFKGDMSLNFFGKI